MPAASAGLETAMWWSDTAAIIRVASHPMQAVSATGR
jgi:hypothetical protein